MRLLARLPPLITLKEGAGITQLSVGLPSSFEMYNKAALHLPQHLRGRQSSKWRELRWRLTSLWANPTRSCFHQESRHSTSVSSCLFWDILAQQHGCDDASGVGHGLQDTHSRKCVLVSIERLSDHTDASGGSARHSGAVRCSVSCEINFHSQPARERRRRWPSRASNKLGSTAPQPSVQLWLVGSLS